MTRTRILISLGVLTALTPFLGLPYSWLMWIVPMLGLAVAGIAFSMRRQKKTMDAESTSLPHDEASLS